MRSVYIVLSEIGTIFSKAISRYTGDPYSHVSISFNPNLDTMYSFGRKRRFTIFDSGLVLERLDKGFFSSSPDARCCILEVTVTDAEYDAMRKMVDLFLKERESYRYNLLGMLGSGIGIGLARKKRFFCSQFVSFVLNKTAFWNQMPELTRPMDFYWIANRKLLFEGGVREYARSLTNRIQTV